MRMYDDYLFERYLNILGIDPVPPCREALDKLVDAQLRRVPFENISKLHYKKVYGLSFIPDLELYLEGIEKHNFGGTCYANNYYLNLLLNYLGYDADLCGADMENPDVHIVSIVNLDNREFIVDVGYAAPFYTPLPRDIEHDYEIIAGHDKYILKPRDKNGCSEMQLYRDGKHFHGYKAKPGRRELNYFNDVITHSFNDDATFMNAILLVRFFPGYLISLFNYSIIKAEGDKVSARKFANRDEIIAAIDKEFGISRKYSTEVINQLGDLKSAWD